MSGVWLVSYIALWVLFLVVAVVLISVLRNMGALYEMLEHIPPAQNAAIKLIAGTPIPELTFEALDGNQLTTTAFRGQTIALTFISPGCGPCRDLLRDLATHTFELTLWTPATTQVIVSLGDVPATRELLQEVSLPSAIGIFTAPQTDVEVAWGVRATPTTVIVDADGVFLRHQVGYAPQANLSAVLAVGSYSSIHR